MGLSIRELFQQTYLFMHGSTVVDNTLLTRDGSPTGLITTAGFDIVDDERMYIPGLKILSYNYWGSAVPV